VKKNREQQRERDRKRRLEGCPQSRTQAQSVNI
jgi:hypothetical protein